MPNIGFGELLVILLIALLVFGPQKLPEMGKTIGRTMREFKRNADQVRAELEVDLEEPPLVPMPSEAKKREAAAAPASEAAAEPPVKPA